MRGSSFSAVPSVHRRRRLPLPPFPQVRLTAGLPVAVAAVAAVAQQRGGILPATRGVAGGGAPNRLLQHQRGGRREYVVC